MNQLDYRRDYNKLKSFKYLIIIDIFLIFSFGLKSCCTEKYCFGANDIGDIELLSFSSIEVDSIFLVYFTKDSDFKGVVDSIMIETYQPIGSDKFYGHSYRNISADYYYKIYFVSINKEYRISGFKTSKSECNDCFIIKDYFTKLDGYEINGKYKESAIIQIDKYND